MTEYNYDKLIKRALEGKNLQEMNGFFLLMKIKKQVELKMNHADGVNGQKLLLNIKINITLLAMMKV